MQWMLGVDGGGSKTRALAADMTGKVLGGVEKGPSNYHVVGLEGVRQVLGAIITEAAQMYNLSEKDLSLVSLGLAGVDTERDKKLVMGAVRSLGLTCPVLLQEDTMIALAAGTGCLQGIIVIAGTGSAAAGVNSRGERFRAGGWGHLISDEGSGYYIGREGVARAVKAMEGRERPSSLLPAILRFLQLSQFDELIGYIYGGEGKAAVAKIAEVVVAEAQNGDGVAQDILRDAGEELYRLVSCVMRQGFAGEQEVKVVAAGSILTHVAPVRERLQQKLANCATLLLPLVEPAQGALHIGVQAWREGRLL